MKPIHLAASLLVALSLCGGPSFAADPEEHFDLTPALLAVLTKHGIGSREFALSTFALVHAGMFVGMESMMDKKQAAEMMGKFTKEQKANIALLRKLGPSAYTLSR